MKKIRKFILIFLSALLTFCTVSSCSNCELIKMDLENNEYFIYTTINEKTTNIVGLTNLGKEQKYLVIPTQIKGRKVKAVNPTLALEPIKNKYGSEKYWAFSSEKLKKIFIPDNVIVNEDSNYFKDSPNLEGVFLPYVQEAYSRRYKAVYSFQAYLNTNGNQQELYEIWLSNRLSYTVANVSYQFNYEEAPNSGYYWIDDYDGEKIGFIPEEPKRNGYTFNGWYKEAECINAWDFNEDTVPKKIYDEEKGYGYQETKLYAKWTENY